MSIDSSGVPRILEWEGRGAAGAEGRRGGGKWGGNIPLATGGRVWVGGVPLPRKFFAFFVENTIF